MKRTEPESLGDILRKAVEESQLSRQFDEVTAINAWPGVIGPEIASANPRPVFRKGVMMIKIFSPALRQELNMQRTNLAKAVNKLVGKDVVNEIKFIG